MRARGFDERPVLLGPTAPVPVDRPFTASMASEAGVSRYQLDGWLRDGLLTRPIRGVFHAVQLADSLDLRIACLSLVVPAACVVTDRTAAWLWGARTALAPNDHLVVPPVSVFSPPGHRLRNGLVSSGERCLAATDVAELGGVRVTTPLRTASDLGRLLHRDQALAAMDALAALEQFSVPELNAETSRFKGYRGVIQLRNLAPYVDPRSQSPQESILRLRWLDVGLPRPECQVEVPAPGGGSFWIDLGLPELRFGAEYDGAAFHTEQHRSHDEWRREWLCQAGANPWVLVVARNEHLRGPSQDIHRMLVRGADAARRALKSR